MDGSNSKLAILSVTAVLLALTSTSGWGSSKTESACLKLEKQIVKYTKLRQNGGSAKQMDRWHRQRSKLKSRYRELDCKY